MNKSIIVGSINMDIVAFVQNHPKAGETIFGKEVRYFPGGKGSNQAVACRRLGCETLMVGRLGDDAFGEQLLAFQQQEGINTRGVRRLENTASGTAFITVSDGGENAIVVIPGANVLWQEDFLNDLCISPGDIVLAQFEIPDAAILQAFKKAKDCGATTLLNPAPVRPIRQELLGLTDLLVLNEHELAALSGTTIGIADNSSVFIAAERLSNEHRTVIVTLGDQGVRICDAGKRLRIEARTVDAVDTTGAGDTFIGGLAAGLCAGMNLLNAAELGNIAASISVTRAGAACSIPTRAEVDKLL